MYEKLIAKIKAFIPLTEDDEAVVKSYFKPLACRKGDVLIKEGDRANMTYFVDSGYLRYYKIVESGEEKTVHLIIPGHFSTCLPSFLFKEKSEEILQTITDAQLLSITRDDLEALYAISAKWQMFGRKIMEFFLYEKEQRIVDQISLSAAKRYEKLLKSDPQLIQHVPIQYIAHYIGIQPESLSRIRKQIFLTNVK